MAKTKIIFKTLKSTNELSDIVEIYKKNLLTIRKKSEIDFI